MEDFVTFEIAKKLKEKGFPIKTKTEGKFGLTKVKEVEILPTISQVLKWLREEKIYIVPTFCVDQNDNGYWDFRLISTMDGMLIYDEIKNRYNSYEQAALAGIEYVLNNLI